MEFLKIILVLVVLFVNLMITPAAFADRIAKKSADYPVVTQTLKDLLQVSKDPDQTEYQPAELQQKISDLKLQKYILETAEDLGICRNETGKTLGVYAHKAGSNRPNTLYYLASGEETDDDYECDGIYLPNDAKIAGFDLTGESSALKFLDGTQLVATSNSETGEIELNLPSALTTLIKAGEKGWSIPTLAQADIDAQTPNAPVD